MGTPSLRSPTVTVGCVQGAQASVGHRQRRTRHPGRERKRGRDPDENLGFITFHYKGRKIQRSNCAGRAAVRALSSLTPTCGSTGTVHGHPQQRSAHAGGRASLGTGRGWDQPFAYIRGAAQPMAFCFLLGGKTGPEDQSWPLDLRPQLRPHVPHVIRTVRPAGVD